MAAAVDIRKIIYDATVNRKPDFLLGMDIKPFLDSEEKRNDLANTLLEQTFQGTIFILCMYFNSDCWIIKESIFSNIESFDFNISYEFQIWKGTIVNSQVLMYLKFCLRAELISCSGLFQSLSSFQSFQSPQTLSGKIKNRNILHPN